MTATEEIAGRRQVWSRKASLRRVYRDFHERLLAAAPGSDVLEVGAAGGGIRQSIGATEGRVVALDVRTWVDIDVNGEAEALPFRDATFDGIVMVDTLHHLQQPGGFLREAARVLRPGGRMAVIEPAITPLSGLLYRRFHEEPVDTSADPLADGPRRDRWGWSDANQAIPTLMFHGAAARRRLQRYEPRLRLIEFRWLSLWAYPLTGGFRRWGLLPSRAVAPLLALEERVLPVLGPVAAFRLLGVLERTHDNSD